MPAAASLPVHLAGFDGSPAATSAVRVAGALASADGAHLVVLVVHPAAGHALLLGTETALEQEVRRRAEELLVDLAHAEVQEVRAASAPRALAEAAGRHGASMVTVGATDRGALGRLAPGSVGERLLHEAPCPVLVVPPGVDERPLRTVGVAVHGGRDDDVVLLHAATLAASLEARLVLISVLAPDDGPAFHAAAKKLEDLAARLGARSCVREGRPGPEVVAACDDVDLLVCGSRAHTPVRAVLEGSVSRHLVDHAPCPVLVVSRPVARAAAREAVAGAAR
ncbi:MAG TPA: universal stress protein [Baekduia sp.]|nr:universal stress protein [Baekduia sp.]